MEYQDFTIDVRSAKGGGFEARVSAAPLLESPTPPVPFARPIENQALEDLLVAFDRPGTKALEPAPPKDVSPRELGKKLYRALFRAEVGDLFQRCRATLSPQGHTGLRLRLRFELNDAEAEYLAALPWEWLCDPRTAEFLAADPYTPVVRDFLFLQPKGALEVAGPLRILVVDATPRGMKKLALRREIERMDEGLAPLKKDRLVELLRPRKATPGAIRETLKDEGIHVLHFMGHGGYDKGSGNGAIFLEKGDSAADQVDGEELACYLKALPSLRLVVLNACKTARLAGHAGSPLDTGVASAVLERTGVPAVVANQYSISDAAAIAFSETFYRRLAHGEAIDEALTEMRLQLRRECCEWATPVLFLTAPHGKLFTVEPGKRRRKARARPSDPVRLGVRTIVGWGADMEKRTDAVFDRTAYFDGRYIKVPKDWQETIFPELRAFLLKWIDERRPVLLDFAAHASIAFAAGWVLEPKSGLDVRVRQRTAGDGEFEWHPKDGSEPEGALWLDRPDLKLKGKGPDIAVALSVSQPDVAKEVKEFIRREDLPIGRLIDARVPEPGQQSVRGGAHSLRLAQALLPRLRQQRPHERGGRVHVFASAPNALVFYLGQLASSLESVVLYEYPFKAKDAYGRYQKSIELPPPDEVRRIPGNW